MRKWFILSLAVVSLGLAGCKVKVPESSKLRCSATPAASTVEANEALAITVAATGGEAPYYILGRIGTFASSVDISRSYTNASDATISVEDVVLVNDNLGFTAQCSFTVSVEPEPSTPTPSLAVVANPSATVAVGSSITVVATGSNLGASPTYAFEWISLGVSGVVTGNQAVFSITDNTARSFDVLVRASGNGEEVTQTLTLSFTAVPPTTLGCFLSHDKGSATVGEKIRFTVTSVTNEAMEITEFDPGTSGSVTAAGDGKADAQWTTSGTKQVKIKAKAKNRNAVCNSGAYMNDSVVIYNALTCTAFTDDTDYRVYYGAGYPSWDGYYYNSAIVWAQVPAASGVGTPRITGISALPTVSGTYQPYQSNPLSKEVFFYQSGTYRLELTVSDDGGHTTKCTTPSFNVWN